MNNGNEMIEKDSSTPIEIKITLLGISGTNNSLLTNLSNSEYRKHLKIDDQNILVDFLDTAGINISKIELNKNNEFFFSHEIKKRARR